MDAETVMPDWMLDIEMNYFQSARGPGMPGLVIWNEVRRVHGFGPLTVDELWIRHAQQAGWSDAQLVRERRDWEEFAEFERLSELREEYRRQEAALRVLPATNQEFFAKRRARVTL